MSKDKKQGHELEIGGKKYTMPKMSTPAYLDYCDISEELDGITYYRRQHYNKMAQGIALAYGNQFTVEDIFDAEKGLSPAEIILEFSLLEVSILREVNDRAEEYGENFTSST